MSNNEKNTAKKSKLASSKLNKKPLNTTKPSKNTSTSLKVIKKPTKIKRPVINGKNLVYIKTLSFLVNLIKYKSFSSVLTKNIELQNKIFNILGFLNYLEDKLKIKKEKCFFNSVAKTFSNMFSKNLEINVFLEVDNSQILEEINTVKVFLLNLLNNSDKTILDTLLKTEEINHILDSFEASKDIGDQDILINNSALHNLPPELDSTINPEQKYTPNVDPPLMGPKPGRWDETSTQQPRNILSEPYIEPSNKYLKTIISRYPSIYPFSSKPKIIPIIKRVISVFSIIGLIFFFVSSIYVFTDDYIRHLVGEYFSNNSPKDYGFSIGQTGNIIFSSILFYFIIYAIFSVNHFLIIPATKEGKKYFFPFIKSWVMVIVGIVILITPTTLFVSIVKHTSNPNSSLVLFDIFLGLGITLYICVVILFIVGMVKRPIGLSVYIIEKELKNQNLPLPTIG